MESIASFAVLPLIEPEKSGTHRLEKLATDSDLHRQIAADFQRAGCTIENIEHVKNFNIWLKYNDKKNQILKRVPQDPDYKLNETYLFHGTTADKSRLCEEGFDVNLASEGCFGKGIYFSDDPKKCLKYAKNNIVLVTRVILGETKEYLDGKKAKMLVREPEKTGNYKGWRFYDSVKGCPRDFMEYVVYRNEQCLLEYIVTFKKAEASPGPQAINTEVEDAPTIQDEDVPSQPEDVKEKPKHLTGSSSDSDTDSSDDEGEDQNTDDDNLSNSSDEEGADQKPDDDSGDDGKDTEEPRFIDLIQSVIPYFKIMEGELTLDQKKAEYKRITLEESDEEVDSMMEKTDEDIERAVYLFFAYKQVREEDEKRKAGEFVEDDPIEDDGSPIFPPMEPAYESEAWNNLSEADKKAKMDKAVEDFLTFTALEEMYRQIAMNYVTNAKYNLDTAVLNYYKSWFS